jgi:hypothetical protein
MGLATPRMAVTEWIFVGQNDAHPAGRILVVGPVGGLQAQSECNVAVLVIFGGRDAASTSSAPSPRRTA